MERRKELQREARSEARFRSLPVSERARRRVRGADSKFVRRAFGALDAGGRRVGASLRRANLRSLPGSNTAITRPSVGRGGLISRLRR